MPYFGACIHTPPPPSNQIIHVRAQQAVQGMHAMDTVRIERHVDHRASRIDDGYEQLCHGGHGCGASCSNREAIVRVRRRTECTRASVGAFHCGNCGL